MLSDNSEGGENGIYFKSEEGEAQAGHGVGDRLPGVGVREEQNGADSEPSLAKVGKSLLGMKRRIQNT